MNSKHTLVAMSVALALGAGQPAIAADGDDEDSVYQWGRWAVISPAAGGPEYVARLTPDAVNNARPEDADEFDPKIEEQSVEPEPPVEVAGFCEAGALCGYATYSKMADQTSSESPGEGEVTPAQVIDVSEFDFTSDDPNGPVLAKFSLEKGTLTDEVSPPGEEPPGVPESTAEFEVTEANAPDFPDIKSLEILGDFDDGDVQERREVNTFDSELGAIVTDATESTLSHSQQETGQEYQFDGVDSGYWRQLAEQRLEFILGEGELPSVTVLQDSDGYFVVGTTATIEQMEAFAAGNAIANYSGYVLDYAAPMQLTFDFGGRTFDGNFSSANGFQGFDISGAVDGVNFAAQDGGREVAGSFFNGGFNASGAVNDGARVGVFSADYNGVLE
jgi:hypothetical protein